MKATDMHAILQLKASKNKSNVYSGEFSSKLNEVFHLLFTVNAEKV